MDFIRTSRPLIAGSVAALGLGTTAQALAARPAPRKDKRPDVIFILTDQQTARAMSCAGNPWLSTPNMDALAADGVRFDRAYCPFPLSGPCRSSLITGCMPFEVGAYDNDDRPAQEAMEAGIGHRMNEAGYECLYAGKWHVPEVNIPEQGTGFRKLCDMDDRIIADRCAEAIDRRDPEKPLFLVASYLNPHEICEFARDQSLHYGELPPFELEACPNLPANFMPSTFEAEAIRIEERLAPRSHDVFDYSQNDWRRYLYGYYRLVERVDREIGRLIAVLKERGVYDDAVIIFSSDHGDGAAAHQWNQKWVLFEECINVPLIVKAPKGKGAAGACNDKALSNIGLDVYATCCDYAGVKLDPERYRGRSLRPVAEGKSETLHDEVFVETLLSSAKVRGWSIVEGRYKYVLYIHFQNREMLYDLDADRGEMVNLAVDRRHASELKRLRRKMYDWGVKTGDKRLQRELKSLIENEERPSGHIRGNR